MREARIEGGGGGGSGGSFDFPPCSPCSKENHIT